MIKEFKLLMGVQIDTEDLINRLAQIDAIVVHHKRYKALFDVIVDCHILQKKSINKKGKCIFGETGAGKSTLLKKYEEGYSRVSVNGITIVPVLRVELDSNSTPRNVASKLLEALGDPFYYKGTEKELTSRLKGLISICKVELIIIDEFQHLIDTEKDKVIRKAADWVKQFANEINVPIILAGILDSLRIFSNNQQLDERFQHKEKFYPFQYSTDEEKKEFRGFLKSVDLQMPFSKLSETTQSKVGLIQKIYDPYLAEKIYYASLGVPRSINHLLLQAATIALRDGKDYLEEKHLHDGFDKLVLETRPKVINPFTGKKFDAIAALLVEKGKK